MQLCCHILFLSKVIKQCAQLSIVYIKRYSLFKNVFADIQFSVWLLSWGLQRWLWSVLCFSAHVFTWVTITDVSVFLQEDAKTMKTKMREKVRPKMGKIDIDYQKLHDAFFKWQIKPKLTIHGDLYYEVRLLPGVSDDTSWSVSNSRLVLVCQGKEFETRLKEKKPGDLSGELRVALGMPTGPVSASSGSALHSNAFSVLCECRRAAQSLCRFSCALSPQNSHKVPPPWLIAMQRYGPPPSYPNLKIPGLNAPIPEVSLRKDTSTSSTLMNHFIYDHNFCFSHFGIIVCPRFILKTFHINLTSLHKLSWCSCQNRDVLN